MHPTLSSAPFSCDPLLSLYAATIQHGWMLIFHYLFHNVFLNEKLPITNIMNDDVLMHWCVLFVQFSSFVLFFAAGKWKGGGSLGIDGGHNSCITMRLADLVIYMTANSFPRTYLVQWYLYWWLIQMHTWHIVLIVLNTFFSNIKSTIGVCMYCKIQLPVIWLMIPCTFSAKSENITSITCVICYEKFGLASTNLLDRIKLECKEINWNAGVEK